MKKRYIAMLVALVISALAVAARGAYLKYEVIRPLGLPDYGDKSILELPFLAMSDDVLQFMLENADLFVSEEPEPAPSESSTAASSAATEPSSSVTVPESTLSTASTETQPSTQQTTLPETSTTTTQSTAAPTQTQPTQKPEEPTFDFQGEPVDQSWYDNVLFLGNSRTCGLRGHARSGKAEYFADYGMTMFKAFEHPCSDKNFKDLTLGELLADRQFDKIVIQFGLNEVGYHAATFRAAYQKLLNDIRELQPNAKFILMGIMAVTRGKYALGEYWHPDNLAKFNDFMKSLANGTDIFYVDPNPYFTDSEGFLFESLTEDGYHLNPAGVKKWKLWLDHEITLQSI